MGAHLYCSSYSQLAGPIDLTSHYYQSALYILHWCKSHKKYLRAPLLRMLAGLTIAVQCSGKFFFAVLGFYVSRSGRRGYGKQSEIKASLLIYVPSLQGQMAMYSLISMRPIYYFDTWAIIWHGIVCWFMVFPRFYQFLFVAIIKLFCTDMKIKTKTI